MTPNNCRHTDVREFDGLRCCLACGETQFRPPSIQDQVPAQEAEYMYTDLRCLEQGQTIRLVVLAPGNNAEPLHCTIVLSGLQYSYYEAISYTWATEDGDATKSQPVHIDCSTLYVTRNCEAALRRLRQAESHRRLWVDAMCINQSNVSERNHQVGLMDQIYRNASRVHVCICHPERDYSDFMRWLQTGDPTKCYLSRAQTQLEALFHCRYFSRVWVLQEVVLASVLVLHVNGDEVVVSSNCRFLLEQACLEWSIDVPGPFKSLLQMDPPKGAIQQLAISITLACSDARDRVYAVLGLLKPATRSLIPINYSMSMEGVFANAVVACIEDTGRLDILYHVLSTQGTETWMQAQSLNAERFIQFIQFETRSGKPNRAREVPERRWLRYPSGLEWVPCVYVKSTNRELQHVSDTYVNPGKFSPVERLPHPLHSNHIFPCLRVRAHFVDILVDSDNLELLTFAKDFQALPRDTFLVKYVSVLGGFRSLYNTLYDWEFRRFEKHLTGCLDLLLKSTISSIESTNVFRTSRDIGLSNAPFTSGDHVYIIDGVDGTFVLREVGYNKFRILGVCCLFTAIPFTSEKWDGCHMDPWGNHSHGSAPVHYCYSKELTRNHKITKETRMIEIY